MKKLKLMTVVGTRPEIIRLSEVIKKCDQFFDQILVHTGQNYDYELNEIFFKDLGLRKPDHFLNAAGKTGAETIGNVIIQSDKVLDEVKPDALLVLGDTNSCMAVIPAKRRKVPTFHMEAGNRCFDMRVPEEINRRIVDHTSDVNLTYSDIAREYLLAEGLKPDLVIKTGSPMFEVLHSHLTRIRSSSVLKDIGVQKSEYFLVSAHREENIEIESNFNNLVRSLNQIAETYNLPIIVSTHPRTRKKIESKQVQLHPLIRLMKPMGFIDYNCLQLNAKVVLSDSGTITEESSIMDFPALNIREAHERPEGMEEASVMMTGVSPERILQGIEILAQGPDHHTSRRMRLVSDYDTGNVSDKIVRIILSYTDYVSRVVWKKYDKQ